MHQVIFGQEFRASSVQHILHISKERCKMQEISSSVVNLSNEVSFQWRHVYVLMSELLTICLKLLNCKSSCDVRLQVWFIFHSHWCLMSVSSQGYGSNKQLLPPNITAYSQFVESTKSIFDQNPCFCCSCDSMLCVIITQGRPQWKNVFFRALPE